MENAGVITRRDIVDFCKITKDSNPIHDPEYMAQYDKEPIVPGLFTLITAAAYSDNLLINPFKPVFPIDNELYLNIDFTGKLLSANQKIITGSYANYAARKTSEDLCDWILYADGRDKDYLKSVEDGKGSRLYFRKPRIFKLPELQVKCSFEFEDIEKFAELIQSKTYLPFWFSIAGTSYALIESMQKIPTIIQSKIDEFDERKYNQNMAILKGLEEMTSGDNMPVYLSMFFQFPRRSSDFDGNKVDYKVGLRKIMSLEMVIKGEKRKKKVAFINSECYWDEFKIYDAVTTLVSFEKQEIIYMAQDIPYY